MHDLTQQINQDNWQDVLTNERLNEDDLIEILADFKERESFNKKVAGYLREVVGARLTEDEHITPHNVKVVRNHRVRRGGLNREMILEEMGEEWVDEHSMPDTEYVELRVSRVKED